MNKYDEYATQKFSSYLAESINSFIKYKVNVDGCLAESFSPMMLRFDKYCIEHPETEVCLKRDTVMGFLRIRDDLKKSTMCQKATVIRSFGKYLSLVLRISDVFIIPKIANNQKTFVPYIFSHYEMSKILRASLVYKPKCEYTPTPNMVNCMSCIFPMLYCTGMRISEITHLKVSDVDLEQRLIHINQAKNDNHRIVTISNTLYEACKRYLDESLKHKLSGIYFFDSGSEYNDGYIPRDSAYSYFRRFLATAGIEHKGKGFGPRMHDIRVTFATHSLQKLSRMSGDINTHLMSLSIYMGHRSIYCTQDYLWLTSELYQGTLDKMEDYTSFISTIFDEKVGELDD